MHRKIALKKTLAAAVSLPNINKVHSDDLSELCLQGICPENLKKMRVQHNRIQLMGAAILTQRLNLKVNKMWFKNAAKHRINKINIYFHKLNIFNLKYFVFIRLPQSTNQKQCYKEKQKWWILAAWKLVYNKSSELVRSCIMLLH